MRRREFLGVLGGVAATRPIVAVAQRIDQSLRLPRIGVLWSLGDNEKSPDFALVKGAFAELGYVDGTNVEFTNLFPWEQADFPVLARKLVDQKVNVIVATNGWAAYWAMNTTLDIPIVAIYGNTIANDGFGKSLSRPGGNTTGLTQMTDELTPKRLALLKEAVPTLARVRLLYDPRMTAGIAGLPGTVIVHKHAAEDLGLGIVLKPATGPDEIERAILEIGADGTEAVTMALHQLFVREHARIAATALARKVPTVTIYSQGVRDGFLMSYGPDFPEYFRKLAGYVDRILKGAKPSDLPIEQPTRLKLAINMKTAKAIGLSMPLSLLVSADEVIE